MFTEHENFKKHYARHAVATQHVMNDVRILKQDIVCLASLSTPCEEFIK